MDGFGPRSGPASARPTTAGQIFYSRTPEPTPPAPPPEASVFFVLPLTYDEEDVSGSLTWVRQGAGPHVTPEGFEGNGWNSRLKSTTIPGWLAGATGSVSVQASITLQNVQPMNSFGDTIVYLGADVGSVSGSSKISLRALRNPNISTKPYLALQGRTTATQTLPLCRAQWKYEGRYPEMSRGGNTALPQSITFVGTGSDILFGAHYQDTESRAFLIDRTTRESKGTFRFPIHTHVGTSCVDSSGSLWMTDSSVEHLLKVDLAASLAAGTASISVDYSLSALSAMGGVDFITVSGSSYMLCAEYNTAGTPYIYVIPYSLIASGSSFSTAQRFKRFQIGLRCQGITIRSGSLWATKNVDIDTGTTCGWLERFDDFGNIILNVADGAALSPSFTMLGASEYVEDLAVDPLTNRIWMGTEGWNAVDDFDGWKGMWSTNGTVLPEESHIMVRYAGTGSTSVFQNGYFFQTVNWSLTPAVATVCIGGPPNQAAGLTTGYFTGYVRNVRIQSGSKMTVAEQAETTSGIFETGSLTVIPITLTNPGAESTTTGWTSESGTLGNRGANPPPFSGSSYFFGGANALTIARNRSDLTGSTGLTPAQAWDGVTWAKMRWYQASFGDQDPCMMALRQQSGSTILGITYSPLEFVPGGGTAAGNWHRLASPATVVSGTRTLDIVYWNVRDTGTNNDGYVDDISLVVYRR